MTAATLNWYSVFGNNSVTVRVTSLLDGNNRINDESLVLLYASWYPIIIPLGGLGLIHDNVTVVYAAFSTVRNLGTVGTKNTICNTDVKKQSLLLMLLSLLLQTSVLEQVIL